MATFVLTDSAKDLWLEDFRADSSSLGLPAAQPWSVTKRR